MDRAPDVGAGLGNERAARVTPTWVWCISCRVGPSDGSRAPRGRRTRQRARRAGYAHVSRLITSPQRIDSPSVSARRTGTRSARRQADSVEQPRGPARRSPTMTPSDLVTDRKIQEDVTNRETPTWAWCISPRVGPWDGSRAHVGAGLGNERAATVTPTWVWSISSRVGPSDGSRAHVGAGLGNERTATVTPTWAWCISSRVGPWPLRARQARTSAEQIYPRPRPRSSENPPGPDTANTRKMTA